MSKQRLKTPRLYKQVAEKLIKHIESGKYSSGMRLPSERELASIFGVSRPTIREAVIALELGNFVEVRLGSGVYVLDQQGDGYHFTGKDVGPFELTEARVMFEGEAAALAALTISDGELSLLEEALNAMAGDGEADNNDHYAADREFHLIIARATRNSVVAQMVEQLWELRESSLLTRNIYQQVRDSGMGVKPSIAEHRDIFEALKKRDTLTARKAMRFHLDRVINGILEATEIEAVAAVHKNTLAKRNRIKLMR